MAANRGRTPGVLLRALELLPVAVLAVFLAGTVILPLSMLVVSSLTPAGAPSLATYRRLLGARAHRQAIANSLVVAGVGAAVATLLGGTVGLALYALRSRHWPDAVTAVAAAAANAGGPPLAFAFVVLLGTQGMLRLALRQLTGLDLLPELGSYPGLVLVYLYFLVPVVLLVVVPALGAVRREIYEAALVLGARPWQFWRRVGLPLLLPPLGAGYVLAFAVALGSYSTPWALVGGGGNLNLLPMQIGFYVGEAGYQLDMADAMAVVLIALAGLCAVAHRALLGRAQLGLG